MLLATTNGPTNIAPTSNSKEEHKKVGGSHHTEKKAIKDVLRTPTSSVLEKRKSLSKKWDDVCRKNEPKFEFWSCPRQNQANTPKSITYFQHYLEC